jgi:hypothetical protein
MSIVDLDTTIDRDALQYVLSTSDGRKVLWDILAISGLYRQPRVAGDPAGTDFNCGALNVGLMLYADCLTVSPDLTAMMMKEQATYDNTSASDARKPERKSGSDTSGRNDSSGSGSNELSNTLGLDRLTGKPYGTDLGDGSW